MAQQFDWQLVGAELLDRDPRPVLLLNMAQRVLRANRALVALLEPEFSPQLTHFADDWLGPAAREAFALNWRRAIDGNRERVQVRISRANFPVLATFELVPLTEGLRVTAVMLIAVEVLPDFPAAPITPASGLHYDIALDEKGQPQRLLQAISNGAQLKVDASQPCHLALFGRPAPCPACPLRNERTGATVAIESASGPFRANLLWARRRPGHATISVLQVGEEEYSALFRARVDALAMGARLSPRERSVLDLILMGRTLDDIATHEGITTRTTKYHQQNLLRKLGAESRHDLLRLLS